MCTQGSVKKMETTWKHGEEENVQGIEQSTLTEANMWGMENVLVNNLAEGEDSLER